MRNESENWGSKLWEGLTTTFNVHMKSMETTEKEKQDLGVSLYKVKAHIWSIQIKSNFFSFTPDYEKFCLNKVLTLSPIPSSKVWTPRSLFPSQFSNHMLPRAIHPPSAARIETRVINPQPIQLR